MQSPASRILSRKPPKRGGRPAATVRPRLELLEDRVVPALMYHGGPILSSVQAQAVYLGSGWSASPIPTSQFDAFLGTTVKGATPYLKMLNADGFYGVTGSGSTLAGVADNVVVSSDLTDAAIQTDLSTAIAGGVSGLQQPGANTLYFVFVQPGTVVDFGNGQTSVNTFLAYHSSFLYNGGEVAYAVVPYHGSAGNAQDLWLNSFDSMTVASSHELAEAITDPTGYGWYDRSGNEIGDIVNGSTVYLNGYAVQREAAIAGSQDNYLAMTPQGAAAGHQTTFGGVGGAALIVNGVSVANPAEAGKTITAVSPQGIDDFGQPMVDVVYGDHNAYEYHDFAAVNGNPNPVVTANPSFFPWTNLGPNVKQAVAGQGVSYVLLTNGSLGEYVDPNYTTYSYGYGVNPGARNGAIAVSVSSIVAAGLDQQGVNAVEYVSGGKTLEWRDVTARASTTTTGFNAAKITSTHSDVGGPTLNAALELTAVQATPAVPTVSAISTPAVVAAAPTPTAVPLTSPTFVTHFRLPEGGGGRLDLFVVNHDEADDNGAASAPAKLADVPVFGPAFMEAVRQLKEAGRMVPPGLGPTAPTKPVVPPPAPAPALGPQATSNRGGALIGAVLAACGAGFIGLARVPQRRRPLRLGTESPKG